MSTLSHNPLMHHVATLISLHLIQNSWVFTLVDPPAQVVKMLLSKCRQIHAAILFHEHGYCDLCQALTAHKEVHT